MSISVNTSSSLSVASNEGDSLLSQVGNQQDLKENDLSSYKAFLKRFPLQGEGLYSTLFSRHSELIQTQKPKFALSNLERILNATFEISSTSGFEKMSLRDLSKKADMSMGAIYSCISKKEDIALMVADIVRLSSEMTRDYAMKSGSVWSQIEQSMRFHLYVSTLLQPWYFFLYFETRSLPEAQQIESTKIELDAISSIEEKIIEGVANGEFDVEHPRMIANTIVVLLEDWYLKPWKHSSSSTKPNQHQSIEKQVNAYFQPLMGMVRKLLINPKAATA